MASAQEIRAQVQSANQGVQEAAAMLRLAVDKLDEAIAKHLHTDSVKLAEAIASLQQAKQRIEESLPSLGMAEESADRYWTVL